MGQYRDFKIWKKARTIDEIQSTFKINDVKNIDSLYYYLSLSNANSNNPIQTLNIANNTSISNESKWSGALNASSTIISQAGTGAKYFYDSTNQKIYGTYYGSLQANEIIQISVDGGSTWKNADTAFNNNWVATTPTSFRNGVIKIRGAISNISSGRVFTDYSVVLVPTNFSYIRKDTIQGKSGIINVNTINTGLGNIKYYITSTPVAGIGIDSLTGQIQFGNILDTGLYTINVRAVNEKGSVSTNALLYINPGFSNKIGGFINNYLQTTTNAGSPNNDKVVLPSTLNLSGNITIELWYKANINNTIPTSFLDFRIASGGTTGFFTEFISGNRVRIYANNATGAIYNLPVGFDITAWHHYAVVSTTNLLLLYIDGVLIESSANVGNIASNATSSNFIGSGNNANSNPATGQYVDFRIWKKAKTEKEIKENYTTPVLTNSDSLYYNLLLTKNNIGATTNIPSNTSINNVSKWSGALNTPSTIISQNNTGATYYFDSTNNWLYGTIQDTVQPNERLEYSIDGGLTWKNVDTVIGLYWEAILPTSFKYGTIQVRSNNNANRVFANYVFNFVPSIYYTPNNVIDTVGTVGSSVLPNIITIGTTRFSITSGGINGIGIDSNTGKISWSNNLPVGSYNLIITASNQVGFSTTNYIINIKLFKDTILYYSNNSFQSNTIAFSSAGDYINLPTLNLDSNYTVETWFNLNAFSGTNYPFIYSFGTWSNGLILQENRTLSVKSWGLEALTGHPLTAGIWNHLAVVVKGRNIKLYVNGVLVNDNPALGNTPTNNNTFINNRIGNGQDVTNTSLSTTVGQYRDFRIWKKARTTAEIQATYKTNVELGWDSLYYNLQLTKNNIVATSNIPNNTSINNASKWFGAQNATSTIISLGGTGAKYNYDSSNQKLYGQIKDTLLAGEKIQISIDSGTSWVNVDTTIGTNWVATVPTRFKWGRIQARSNTNASRVFAHYVFYFTPSITYSLNNVTDTSGTTGESVLPTVKTSGTTKYYITSGSNAGIQIDSNTGKISWLSTLASGTYNLVISAINEAGPVTTNFSLTISNILTITYNQDTVVLVNYGTAGNSNTPVKTGGNIAATYSFSSTTPAVSGITINSSTGVISWSNTAPVGTYTFRVIATSVINADSSQYFRVRINSLKPILSYSLNPVRIDQGISDSSLPTINATGLPIRYKIIGDLVTGISIDSISGVIKWTSKVSPSIYSLIIQAKNSVDSVQTSFTLQINQLSDTILYFNNSAFQSTTSAIGPNGDYINLPTLNLDSNYTVETWFNLNANTGTNFPFIYNIGGWANSNSNGLIINTINRTLHVKSWGVEANGSAPNNLTGYSLVPGVWTHLAMVVRGRNTKVYVNGSLIKEYTSLGNTPTNNNIFTNNRIGNGRDVTNNNNTISTTLGQYRDFRIWKKVRSIGEIQATYRGNVLRNSDDLYYYLPLDNKLFTTRNVVNDSILSNYATATGSLNGTSTIISQNGRTGAKYFVDSTNQRLTGKYKDSLLAGETIQVSYDSGTTWRAVKYAANNNWYDSLTSVFNGGLIKVRSVIGGVPTTRYFADFIQYIKPTAPQLSFAASYEAGKALVNFGVPIKTGGTTINNYVVVSQPGNITSSSAGSPILVTGLTNSTSYTFRVVANNVAGVSDSSVASNSVTPSSTYTITTSVKNGNINVGPISVNVGGSYRITYTGTNNNYTIDSIIINNTNVIDSTNGYTFNNIGTNNTIRVVYKIKTGLVRLNQGTNGINTPFGINQVQYGSSLRVSYVSNRGYKVDSIKINEIYYGGGIDSGTYTFTNILGDSSINITYKLQTNTITSSTNNVLGGNININNSVVNYGGSALVSYAPNAGYYIDSVYINGVYNKDSLVRYTLNNITTNQEVRVIFRGYEKPDSVSNVLAQGGNEKAIITFTLPINIKNAGEVKYYVSSTPDNITASGIGSPLIVTGLTNGTSYTFIVQDSNAYGSSNSSISNAVIPTNGLVAILTSAGVGGVIQGSTNIDTSVIKTYRVTYTNQTGYILDSIIVNGVYKGKDSSIGYTFKNIGGDSLIRVVYKSQTYSITSSVNNVLGGSILPSGVNNVVYGSNPQYTIIPNAGYNVDSIKVNNVKVGVTGVYGFANITSANTIVAYFSKIQYNIVSAVVNGTINPVGTRVVGYDTTIRYTYSGNGGYILDSVIVNGEKVDSPSGYTFKNVRSNQNIRVKYKIPSYTITSIVNGPATITPLGNIQVISGGSASYNILASANIQIDSILVNNIKINNVTSYTFSNVTSNQSIVVYSKTILVLGKPQNILVQAQSSKQILISWQAPQNLGVGSILNYEITGISSRGIVSTQTTGGTSILFNVDSFYTYKFVVKARNIVGLSDGDTSQLFSTIRYIGIKPVLVSDNGLSKTDKISTDVRVKLSSQDSLLIPIGYGIIYSYDSGKTYTQQIYNGGNFIIPQQNNNLGNKNIIIRVILGTDTSAINEGINVVLATTPDKTTIKGVSKTGNQIQVRWVKPFDGGTGITGYEIQAISTIGDTIITNIDTVKTDTSYLIRVKTNTGYKVTIKAINAIGKSITTDTSDNIFIFQTITPQLVNDNGVSTTDKITSDGRTYILPTGVFKDSLEANRFLIPLVQYAYLQELEYYNNTLLTASYLTINGTIAKRCVKYYNLEPHPSFPITQNNCDTVGFKVVNISNNVPTGLEIKSNMVYKYSLDSGKTYVTPVSGVYTIPTSAGFGNKNTRVKLFLTDNSDSSDLGTGLSFTLSNTPTKPIGVIAAKLVDTGSNKIQVSWKKPVDTAVVIRNYNIIGIASNGANLSATALGTDTSYTFTNIPFGIFYYFVVQASNDIGVSLSDTTKNTLVFIKPISPLVYNDNGVSTTDKITSDGRFYVLPEVQPKLYQGGSLVDFGGKVIAFKNYTDAYNSIYGISQGSGYYARAYYLGENGDLRVTCKSPNNSYNIINESYPGGGAGCAGNYSIQYAQWLSVSNTTSVAVVPLGYNFKYIINNGADINPGSFINGLPNVAGTYSVKIKLSAPNNVDSVVGSPLVYTLVTVPDTPINVLALAGDSIATISFVAPLNTGGLSIDSFKVVSTPGNKSITGNTSPIIIRGLQNNTAYSFAVTAFNNVGSSAPRVSNIVTPNKYYNITTEVVNGSILSNQSVIRFGSIRITYINNAGYILDSVIINGVYKGKDSVNGYTFKNVTNDSTIRVVYKIVQNNLNIDIGNGGTSSQQSGLVIAGTNINLNINANQNFIIDSIFVNSRKVYTFAGGQEIGLTSFTYLLNNILGDSSVKIRFRETELTNSPTIDSVIAMDRQVLIYFKAPTQFGGTSIIRYIATAQVGNLTASGISSPITITGLTNRTTYNISINAINAKGTSPQSNTISTIPNTSTQTILTEVKNGQIQNSQVVNTGSNITITYLPNTGYKVDSIIVNGVQVDTMVNKNSYTFNNITNAQSIRVVYKITTFNVNTLAENGGTISASQIVNYGENKEINIGSIANYIIDTIKINSKTIYSFGGGQTIGLSNYVYNIQNIRGDSSIFVKFRTITVPSKSTIDSVVAGNSQAVIHFKYPQNFGGVNIGGYNVVSVGTAITASGTISPIIVTGLTNGNSYRFAITANNIKGSSLSDTSNSVIPNLNSQNINTVVVNGNISATQSVLTGSNISITYNTSIGFALDSIIVDGVSVDTNVYKQNYTFTNVQTPHSIKVYYKQKSYTITTNTSLGGLISASKNVYFDSAYTVTYGVQTGYKIDSVKVGGIKQTIGNSYIFSGVRSAQSINLYTSKLSYQITTTVVPVGSGLITASKQVNYDSSFTFTFNANEGYILDSVKINGVKVIINNNSYTIDTIKTNQIVEVTFKLQTYTINSSAGIGGTISPIGITNVNYNNNLSYNITPNNGYLIDSLIVNDTLKTSSNPYLFTNIKSNQKIRVTFKIQRFTIKASVLGIGGGINPSGTSALNYGENKTYFITPNSGYEIDSLKVNGIKVNTINNSYTFDSVKSNQTIEVRFKLKNYTITATAGTGGSISPVGVISLNNTGKQQYTIIPNAGYVLDTLFVNGIKVDSISSFTFDTVTINKTIFAKFRVQTFTIIATAGTGGSINPLGVSTVNYGGKKQYIITPNAGYVLDTLFVNSIKVDSITSYTFDTVKVNKTILAKFKLKTFTITSSAGAGGSISPSGTTNVNYAEKQKYTITPNVGYVLDTLFVNGIKVDSISSFTFDTVTINKTISAKFRVKTFTITATAGTGGSISPLGVSTVNYGGKQKYTITPNIGYVLDTLFVNGIKVDSITSYTFDTVTINKTISAKFRVKTFTITATAGTGGSISPLGVSTVNYGGKQKYTITPNVGYVLDTLFVNGIKVDSISSFTFDTVTINKIISAKFRVKTFTITATAGTGGSISPLGVSTVNYGGKQNYTITPNIGYVLDTLFVNGIKVDSITSYTFDTVTINKTIVAKFRVKTFTITATAGTGGSISPLGVSTVNYGGKQKYTITPNAGYVLDTLFVNGIKVDSITSYTFDTVTINKTISAKFRVQTFTITATAGTGGSISPLGITNVNYAGKQKYTITPNIGYVLDTLFVNGIKVDSNTSYTFDTVKTNKTIVAKFRVQTFTITATAGTGGSISPLGTTNVNYAGKQKYTITPNAGYVLDTLFVNGIKVDSITSYTFDTVTINKTISAKFRVQTFTITSSAGTGGSISPLGVSTVNYGGKQKYTITPNAGYVLDTLFVNGIKVDSITSYTFDTVTINKTISAKFRVQTFTITATAGTGGSISPLGITNVNYAGKQKYTITPNAGYVLDTLFVNGIKVDSITSYTFDTVKTNKTIVAKFRVQTFTITATAGTGGSISPLGVSTVNYGAIPTYTITPNTGFVIDTVTVNGTKVTVNNNTYTFDSVKSIKSIVVNFKPITKPSKPLNVLASAGNTQSTIVFSNSIDNGGVPIIKYIVQVIGGNQKDSNISSPITITGLINGQQYKFSVKSVNSFGLASDTTESNIIIPDNSLRNIKTSSLNGTITKDTSITVGGNVVISYNPNEGYELDSIYINNIYSSTITRDSTRKYTFRNILNDSSIRVVNKIKTYSIISSAGIGGSITPSGTNSVIYGGKQKYTITPSTGYVLDTLFVNGIKVDSNSSYTFDKVKVNKTIVAKFKVQTFTITSSAGTGGSISPQGTTDVNYNLKKQFTITPNIGYVLDTLFVNGIKVDSISSYTFDTVKVNKTIVAKFKVQTFTITATAGTGGSISPSGTTNVNYAGKQKYTITPNAGYVLDTLFVNGIKVDSNSSYTFDTVKVNKTIVAKFKVQTFTITSSAGAGGSISPQGTSSLNYGTKQRYTIATNTGYVIDTVFVNNVKVDSTTSYTFDSVKSNQSISVKFKVQTFTITSSAGTGGSISPQGTSTLNYGTKPRYTIALNTGYVIDTVFVNNVKVDSTTSYTFDSLKSNQSISVKFKVQTFTITSSAGTGGSISPQGTSTLNYGTKPRYTIALNTGYVIDTVFVNNVKVDSTTSYTFDSLKSNQSISVKFKVQTFTITSSAGTGGSISPQGTSTLNYGTKPRYTIALNTGYVIDTVFVNNVKVDSTTSYTFDSLKSNQSISVKFKVQTFTITSSAGTGGSISPQGTSTLNYGTKPRYTIALNTGYVIDTVFVNNVKVDSTTSYTFDSLKSNQSISVKFKVQTFTITSSAGTGGSISPQGTSTLNYGTKPRYTIALNTGYVIDTVFVNNVKVDSTTSYTFDSLKSNQSISVKFKVQTFTITSSAGTGGSISPQGTSTLNYGTKPRYTIALNTGYVIDTVFVNNVKVDSTTSYTFDSLKSNQSISVKFKVQTFTITSSAGTGGSISPQGTSTLNYGTKPRYTIALNTGYVIDTVFVNNVKVDSTTSYTFDSLKSNQSISVKFKVQTFTITSSAGTGGSISPQGTSTLNYGTKPRYTIALNTGYVIDTVFVNNVKVDSTTSYTFDSLKSNQSISVKFKVQTFTITSSAGTGGSISPQGTSTLNYGTKPRYTIALNTGYVIDTVFVNNVKVDSTTSYTFDSVKSNQSISVKFKVQTFTITSTAGTGGSISPEGTSTLNYGTQVNYTITPNIGFVIDTVFVNDVKVDSTTSYTFDSVKSNQSISVKFKVQTFTITSSTGKGGSISPEGESVLTYNSNQNFKVFANRGYLIDSVFVNDIYVDSTTSYTFDSVKSNQTIFVKFKINNNFKLVKTNSINGKISQDTLIELGGNRIVNYEPNQGYVLDSIFINDNYNYIASRDSVNSYTFRSINGDSSIKVIYKIQTFTITESAGTGGSIASNGNGTVNYGDRPNYTIKEKEGYEIDSLIVNGFKIQNTNSYVFDSVKSNQTIRVTFKIKTYTITAIAGNGGSISAAGTRVVNYGARPTYTITPDIGYKIDSVFVNGFNIIVNNNSYTFDSVKSNQTIRVIFSKQRLNILSESGVGGSISPSGVVIANSGESVTYQFFAAAGFVLDSIIIDDTNVIINNITSYTFRDIKVDHKIRVKFKRTLFEITSIVGEGGLINVNGRVLVNVGQSYSFYLKTQTGYVLDSLLIDGVVVDTTSVYTFTNIQANHTIQAKYKRTNYIIYSQTNEGGFISPRGQVIRNIGEDQKYTIIPQVGYLIDSVVVDGNKVDSTTSYTFKSIDRSHNIYVYFKSNRYEITSSAGVGGKISPQGKVYLQAGQSQEYKIKANNNTEIDSVFVDGLYVGKLSVYRFENVQMGHTIRATFKNNLYTIVSGTSLVNGQVGGRINPAGVYKIRGGRNKTYKITTNAGFVVDSILIDGVAIDKTMELYTFTNVLDNHTIRVVYNTTPVGNIKNIKRVDAEPSSFVVQSSSNIPGLIDFEGTQVVSSGDTVVFEAINNTDYVLDSILLDGVLQTVALNNNIFSLDNIQANHTIQYYFSKISYNIISKVKGVGGIITPFGTTAVEKGSSVRYGLYPNVGYVVDSLWINGYLKTDSTSGYTFTNIQDSGSIEVKFKQNIYIITSTSNEGGTISPLGTVNVELGGSQVYQISPNSGYIIDSLLIDGALNNDSTTRYTFRDVQKNHTIKVLYKSTINYITTEVKGLGGSISPLGTSRINKGDSLKLRIIPDEKYALDSIWLDDLYQTSTINQGEYVVSNVSGNSKVKVQFKQVIFEITSEQKDTFGTITPLGKQLVKTGETIGYKITTKTGYKIDSLLVDGNIIKDSNTGYTFVEVNADHKIQVSYKIQTYTISAGAGIGGSISSLGVSVVNYGAKPTYTITPNAGYDIDSVLVNGNKINNITSYTFDSVLSNQTIEVRFKLQTYTISATSGTGGTISQNGVTNVNYGSRPSYTITPNTGNVIDSVLVNGTKVTVNNNVYTFDSVKTNQTIWVTFKIQTYTITATSGTGGTISQNGVTNVNYGSRPSYTITVNAGYVLDSVLVNGQKVSITNNVYTFDSVKSNQTIRVTFKIQTYTISATAGVGGTIIQNGTTTVNYGSRPSYIITANAGYVIDSVLVNGTKVSITNNVYTFDSVKTNQTIRVTFKIQTYTITATAGTGGTISPSGTTTVNYGSRPSYIITANAGYVIDSVLVNGTKVNITNNVYTFDSVKSNKTIRATFKTIIVCSGTKVSPNIVRVGVALQSDITTFAKHRWYLDGTIKDSTLTNSYTPPTAGVYTMLGLDANGCESNLSKKYYYSKSCIIPSGRLGNGATIEGNIIGNSNQIIVKWCTDIIQTELTLRAIDISGVVIYDQKISANTGTYIIYKSELKSNGFYVQVLDSNGEIIQISDIIKK